jgi:pyruvate/2-oxoglutarate dehydrogenase complex dihydrolipoamide acyltransferase (E2) component
VLYDGGEFGTATAAGSPEEEDFLGLPGLLDPDQVRTLLRKRQDSQLTARTRTATPQAAHPHAATPPAATSAAAAPQTPSAPQAPPAAPPVSRQALAALRKELNGLVGAWSHRTGQAHGVIHNELRRTCGGPPLPQATADQIRDRIDTIRRWAISGR